MGRSSAFDLPLGTLCEGKHTFTFDVDGAFFEAHDSDEIRGAELLVSVDVKAIRDTFALHIRATGNVTIPCDRCLDDMTLPVDATYDITLKYGDCYDDNSDTTIIIPDNCRSFDVAPLIYDTVVLAVPLQHFHDEGFCNPAMDEIIAAHSGEINDTEADIDPRWNALGKLLDNK